MLNKAISKLRTEIDQNKNNPYIQVVGEYLMKYLEKDPGAAEKILHSGKTIEKSLDEMKKVAEKKKTGNYSVLTPQEGFDIVMKYFGIKVVSTEKAAHNNNQEVIIKTDCEPENNFDIKLEDLLEGGNF
jgi:hypothetical protein